MTDVVSTRLNEKEIEELNKISERESMDRSSLIRKFLLAQIQEYRLKESGEKYRKGLVSMAEAATLAKVSIYTMMDYVDREKIQSPSLSDSEMEEDFKRSKELFDEIK